MSTKRKSPPKCEHCDHVHDAAWTAEACRAVGALRARLSDAERERDEAVEALAEAKRSAEDPAWAKLDDVARGLVKVGERIETQREQAAFARGVEAAAYHLESVATTFAIGNDPSVASYLRHEAKRIRALAPAPDAGKETT